MLISVDGLRLDIQDGGVRISGESWFDLRSLVGQRSMTNLISVLVRLVAETHEEAYGVVLADD